MRILAIVNQKGGCGKTTSAISLAGHYASRGKPTLLVDLDPQSHCAAGLAVPEGRIDLDAGDALLWSEARPLPTDRLLWRIRRDLDLMPSRVGLAGLEAGRGRLSGQAQAERRLERLLARVADRYEVCILDCPPTIGLLTYNALAAATDVLIPVDTGFFSLQGAARQVSTVRAMGRRVGRRIPFWLVATIHDAESPLAQDLLGELRRRFGERLAPVVVHRDPRLKEAASFGLPICEYAPDSTAGTEYAALGDWVLEQRGKVDEAREGGGAGGSEESSPPAEADAAASAGGAETSASAATLRGTVGTAQGPPITVRVTHSPPTGLGRRLSSSGAPTDARPRRALETGDAHQGQEGEAEGGTTLLERRVHQLRVAGSLFERIGSSAPRVEAATGVRDHTEAARGHAPVLREGTGAGSDQAGGAACPPPLPRRAAPGEPPIAVDPRPPAPEPSRSPAPGVAVSGGRVRFVVPAYIGHSISVAGEFNGWSAEANPMLLNPEAKVFETTIELRPGRYEYRLVVDGHWTADPFNPGQCLNPFGEPNSVVVVGGGDAGA